MGFQRELLGPFLSIVVAVLAGLGLAYLDSRPGYDDTGITAAGLAVATLIAVLIDGSARTLRVAALAILVGIWIPVFELAQPGTFGPLMALVFSAVGAFVGWVIVRGLRGPAADQADKADQADQVDQADQADRSDRRR